MQRGARRDEAEQALHAADLALDRANADQALRDLVAGHAASIRGFLLRIPALKERRPLKLIAVSQEALRLLPPEAKAIRSTAALNMGYGFWRWPIWSLPAGRFVKRWKTACPGQLLRRHLRTGQLDPCALLEGRLRRRCRCARRTSSASTESLPASISRRSALHILKGNILLEFGLLQEAEQALTEGLDLVRWIGRVRRPKKGYTALASTGHPGDRPAAMEAVNALEESWPGGLPCTPNRCATVCSCVTGPMIRSGEELGSGWRSRRSGSINWQRSPADPSAPRSSSTRSMPHVLAHCRRASRVRSRWKGFTPASIMCRNSPHPMVRRLARGNAIAKTCWIRRLKTAKRSRLSKRP
jgi:hypothetical protein